MQKQGKISLTRLFFQVGRLIRYREFGAIVSFMIIFVTFSYLSRQFLTLLSLAGVLIIASEM
jgi:hypothetical protein